MKAFEKLDDVKFNNIYNKISLKNQRIKLHKMRTITLMLLLLTIGFTTEAFGSINQLTLWSKDGTKVEYYLNDRPKITFTDTHAVITSNGIEMNYPFHGIERITYGKSLTATIHGIEGDASNFNFDGETLVFHDIEAGTVVSVYSINGILLLKDVINETGRYALGLSGVTAGIYLININGTNYKIIKK